jgi:hypothetical protein
MRESKKENNLGWFYQYNKTTCWYAHESLKSN